MIHRLPAVSSSEDLENPLWSLVLGWEERPLPGPGSPQASPPPNPPRSWTAPPRTYTLTHVGTRPIAHSGRLPHVFTPNSVTS